MSAPIHPDTSLGPVHLTAARLEDQVRFYQEALGLRLNGQGDGRARLGAGTRDLLVLTEVPGARLPPPRSTGLHHVAILLPSRRDLARSIVRLAQLHVPQSPTDHIVTESTYLKDPEGNEIELYTDTPEDGSSAMENSRMVVRGSSGARPAGAGALDLDALLATLRPDERLDTPVSPQARIGHVLLKVTDLGPAVAFYHGVLGFDVQTSMDTAVFVSAGGYHHHIGLNVWAGLGAPPPAQDAIGMRHFTVLLPDGAELERPGRALASAGIPGERFPEGIMVADPSGNRLFLTA